MLYLNGGSAFIALFYAIYTQDTKKYIYTDTNAVCLYGGTK